MTQATTEHCPNCGRGLRPFRHDRQQAGNREVSLHWMICGSCGHVALHRWGFVERSGEEGELIRETRPRPSGVRRGKI
jgi:hypothetical protein